jgi:hypothetical protein
MIIAIPKDINIETAIAAGTEKYSSLAIYFAVNGAVIAQIIERTVHMTRLALFSLLT